MIEVLIVAGVVFIGGMAVTLMKSGSGSVPEQPLDVLSDFKEIKRAMAAFKKDNINKLETLKQLQKYLDEGRSLDWSRYALTPDEKFLVVSRAGKLDVQRLIEAVGGNSRLEGDKLYLSFLQFKLSEVEPKAAITMHPGRGITTTTSVEWSTAGSVVEGNEIREEEWENRKEIYSEPGHQTVRLRVMDRNENWSEWASVSFEVEEVGGIASISAGMDYLLIVHNSGKVAAFGNNKFGQLGNGSQSPLKEKTFIASYENIEHVSCGETHVLAKDNQGKVFSVGSNDYGQLGIGNRLNSRVLQKIWGLEKVKQLAAGKDFSAAVLMTGAVLTWGNNENGQLGEDKPLFQEIPRRVKNVTNVKQVALGHQHMLCALYDGTVLAWGDNSRGQVGSGFKGKGIEPTLINVKGIKQVAAGRDFSLVLAENGKVFGWGNNTYGQLGLIGENEVLFPKEIPKLKGIVKLVANASFALALTEIGEVYTWGRYHEDEDEFTPTPALIDGLKYVKDIAASHTQAFVLTERDEILTWGSSIDLRVPLGESLEALLGGTAALPLLTDVMKEEEAGRGRPAAPAASDARPGGAPAPDKKQTGSTIRTEQRSN